MHTPRASLALLPPKQHHSPTPPSPSKLEVVFDSHENNLKLCNITTNTANLTNKTLPRSGSIESKALAVILKLCNQDLLFKYKVDRGGQISGSAR